MGGLQFKIKKCICYPTAPEVELFVDPPELSPSQMLVLKKSWVSLKRDITSVGVVQFINMLDTHPEVEGFLPFVTLSKQDEHYSLVLRQHALRVMAVVEKCINRLDQPEQMNDILEELGERHATFDAKIDYVDMLGSYMALLAKEYSPQWTEELENSWHSLIHILVFHIKKAWSETKQCRREVRPVRVL